MRTYAELFRTPEFTALFLASSGQVAAQTVGGLALGTLVFAATGSPLLSALAMFGPSLAQVVGAVTLLSAADRLPPRAAMTGMALLFGAGTAFQAVPGLPVWGVFAVVLGLGVVASLGGGVRYGLLDEILAREGYLLGRSMLNMSAGVMQICGFAAGGVLVAALSPRGALLTAAGLYAVAAGVARWGLSGRPARAAGRASVRETWRSNALLWSGPRRRVFLALWVPNGLIVGCESLYVPYAPRHAGLLFACGALGMLVGDVAAGRLLPERCRARLVVPLCLLLAVPYLVFAVRPALPVAVAAVVLATVGYASGLLLQERLMALTPEGLAGHALGLHSSGMLTMQGVGAALAGAVAERTSPSAGMAVMAAASVVVTLVLAPGLRPGAGRGRGGPGPAGRDAVRDAGRDGGCDGGCDVRDGGGRVWQGGGRSTAETGRLTRTASLLGPSRVAANHRRRRRTRRHRRPGHHLAPISPHIIRIARIVRRFGNRIIDLTPPDRTPTIRLGLEPRVHFPTGPV